MIKQITYLLSTLLILFVLSSCITTGNSSDKDGKNHKETTTDGDQGAGHNDNGEDDKDDTTAPSGIYDIGKRGTKIGSDMNMKIISVKESRCPTNTNCFVAGEAKIVFQITVDGRSVKTTMSAKGNCEGDDGKCGEATTAAGHKIQLLNLYPYPKANSKIDEVDYIAKVKVN